MKMPVVTALLLAVSVGIILFLSTTVHAQEMDITEINGKINSIVHYAEEYEIGNINYFQLNVYGHKIRSDLNLLFGGKIGNEWGRIPKENVAKVLGTPTEYTNWVWVDNKHTEKRFDDAMPWWERIIFDGRKIRITFNAFPSAIEMENGTLFRYYSVDLNVKFKKEYNFDLNSMMKEVASLAADYNMTRTKKSGEALAKKMLETQSVFGRYAQENSEQCTEIMQSVFTPEEKSTKEKVVWWKFPLYNGSDFDIMVNVDMCEDCEFHYINFMLDVEGRGPMNVFNSPELQSGKLENKIDEEYFQALPIENVLEEFRKTVFEVRDEAQKFDKTRSSDFPKKFFFYRFKVQQLNRILDGKYNDVQRWDSNMIQNAESNGIQGPGGCKSLAECRKYCEKMENTQECRKFTYNLRVSLLEKMFAGFKIEKTPHDRIWWERRIFENFGVRQDSWCRHVNDIRCKEGEGCIDGKCVFAPMLNKTCEGGDGSCVVEYVCNGRNSTIPCDELTYTACGKNQVLAGNECACRDGFKDCDNDGDCESVKSCGFETCDDGKDNNNDGSVDCQDAKCNRQVCGIDDGKDLLCINKMCIPPEKEVLPKEPEPVCGNHICERTESKDDCAKDCVICEAYEPPECPNGKIVWKGEDVLGCSLPPICVVTEKACEVDVDCPQPKCGVSQCINGGCKVMELATECEEVCRDGTTKKRECKDGSEIATAVCSANDWVKTGYDCSEARIPITPETPENETTPPETLKNETEIPKTPANETKVPEPPKNETGGGSLPETPIEKVPEEIAPEVEKETRTAGGECTLMNDCGGSQDVCSNGNCVTLPIAVEEKKSSENEKPSKEADAGKPVKEPESPPKENPVTGEAATPFDFVTGWFTGLFGEGDRPCTTECKPCEECNQKFDELMKRVASGEVTGPGNCKNRMECEEYCQREEHKGECTTFFSSHNIETSNCWQSFCRECDKCRFKAGEFNCSANQQFDMEEGFCKCNDGWYECDGDWENGCESDRQCGGCQSKDECAKDRCAPWGNVIQQFDCFKGEEWVEEKGVLRLEGQCRFYPTKRTESHLAFDMWGEPFFEGLSPIKEAVERERGFEWCGWELDNLKKERADLQKSFTQDSLKWFFEEYVPSSPGEWEKHIGGIYDSYWRIVNNAQRTAEMMRCIGTEKWPDEFQKIDISYNTAYGSVRIWEAETTTDFFGKSMKMFSPYMRIWVFPPKDFVKNMFQRSMEMGTFPSPDGEKKPEFSPSEIEAMKNDSKLMKMVESLSDKYGGEAKILLNIVDGQEIVFGVLATLNPDTVMKIEPTKNYTGEYDAKVVMKFDFFYNLMSTGEKDKGGDTAYPPWETGIKIGDFVKGIADGMKMWYMVTSAVVTGDITAEPSAAIGDGLEVLRLMFERGPK